MHLNHRNATKKLFETINVYLKKKFSTRNIISFSNIQKVNSYEI